jgi:WD40 repeat protein
MKPLTFGFCLDENHLMASANTSGDIALWNLEKRRLQHSLKGAHNAFIASVEFLMGQPILVSSGADNSLKVCTISYLYLIIDVLSSNGYLTKMTELQGF